MIDFYTSLFTLVLIVFGSFIYLGLRQYEIGDGSPLRVLSWETAAQVGNLKFVRSMYIWIIIVPIAAKSMSLIKIPTDFGHLVPGLKFELSLPFSWQLFFASAFMFSVSNLIFIAFCPEIIRRYKNYSEFLNDGRDHVYLIA